MDLMTNLHHSNWQIKEEALLHLANNMVKYASNASSSFNSLIQSLFTDKNTRINY